MARRYTCHEQGPYPSQLMLRILAALDRRVLLSAAETYYSERVVKPQGPLAAKEHVRTKLARGWSGRSAEIRLDFFEDEYYTNYFVPLSWEISSHPC